MVYIQELIEVKKELFQIVINFQQNFVSKS